MKLYDGLVLETPIMAGPIGLHGKGPESGMVGYARSVNEAGSIYWADFHDPKSWYQLLSEGCRAIRVIKPLADNERLLEEIRHDTEAGAAGYAMDIDHGMTAYGEPDGQQEPFASKTVGDLKLLSDASPLPFYLKGVVSVHDALLAREAGAAGFVVSGHNNRFPCMVPPLKILPKLRSAVGPEMKIFVDGGINTGYDAFKALALGADGVLCARSFAGAFIQNGEDGLTDKILEMTAELKGAMANTGSPDLAHINRESLVLPSQG
jgi:isopentenyl diphosphate isomerase/L-lactate dehydrogenase-like FMN-dependent dehydrogenase